MADFGSKTSNARGLASEPVAITPNDTATSLNEHDLLFVGGSGDITITPIGGDTAVAGDKVTFSSVAAGWFPVPCIKVWSTGTAATGIVGCSQG